MNLWYMLIGGAVLAGAVASTYVLTQQAAIRPATLGTLASATAAALAYLRAHPVNVPTHDGIIAGAYSTLPPAVQARISLPEWEQALQPILHTVVAASASPPMVPPDPDVAQVRDVAARFIARDSEEASNDRA